MEKKKTNIYLKAGAWAMISEILVRAVSFLSTPIFTRLLPMAVYGNVKTYESWLAILAPILSIGLSLNIEVAQYHFKDKFKKYVSSNMTLIILLHIVILFVVEIFHNPLCRVLDFTHIMLILAVLYSCFYNCTMCVLRSLRILLDYKKAALLSALSSVPSLLISIAVCMVMEDADLTTILDARIAIFYIPIVLVGMGASFIYFVKQREFVNLDYWKYAVKISAPLIMYQISLQVLTQSDRIMIKNMVSSEIAAIFSIATTVIYIIEIIHKGFTSAWIPWLYNQLDKKNYKNVSYGIIAVLAAFGISMLGLLFIGVEIIYIFGGKGYMDAKWLLGPMFGGVMFQVLMLKYADIEKFFNKGNYIAIVSVIIVIVNLVSNYFGILFGGYRAASYTTMISYIVAVIIHSFLIRKKIPEIKLYDKVFFVEALIFAILLIACMYFFFLPTIVRYACIAIGIIAFLVAAIYVYKKYPNVVNKLIKSK